MPDATPEIVPFWKSKRVLMFGLMVAARVVPAIWHNPAVKDICDWILNAAIGGGGYFVATSSRAITLGGGNPPVAPQA